MRRKLLSFVFCIWLFLSLSVTAHARNIDPDHWGSITVTLAAQDEPVVGAELQIFFVAEAAVHPNDTVTYAYTDFFQDCGIALEDPSLAAKLSAWVEDNPVPNEVLVTDDKGRTVCEDLPLGLYLLKQTGEAEGFSTCSPFLVTIPLVTDAEIIYDVDAAPKTDVARLVDITIKNIWIVDKGITIPDSITVELLCDGQVVETALLTYANGWFIAYENMPASDAYSVRAVNVPPGFTTTYARKGYDFTVYNTATLAQTGQTVWPIPVLAVTGLLFLTLGFVLLRKPGKRDA